MVDHTCATDINIINRGWALGYSLQCVTILVFVTQEDSTVPFYRLFSGTKSHNLHTISTTERDNASNNEYIVVAGDPFTYIYLTQVCGSVPFYRLHHETKKDNFCTTSESERVDFIANQGYTTIVMAEYLLSVICTQCA
jgi:hypothetical protein